MRPHVVIVLSPLLDPNLRFDATANPPQAQMFVPKLPVERFIGRILPRLPRIDVRRFDLRVCKPAEDRRRDELRPVVRAEVARTSRASSLTA